jgi:hypothetical protein
MVKYQCPQCTHIWEFKGTLFQKFFVTCPSCHHSIKPLTVELPIADTPEDTPWMQWTEFDIRDLKEMYKEGKETKVISFKLGIDIDEIIKKIEELGLSKEPITVKQTYDIPPKKGSSFVDEDEMMLKDHDLRAQQVQLQKEMITEIKKSGEVVSKCLTDLVRATNAFSESLFDLTKSIERENQNLEKMINYIEVAMKKKQSEIEQPYIKYPLNEGTLKEDTIKTSFKCPQCGRQSVFPRANGVCLCNTCKWEGTKQDLSF